MHARCAFEWHHMLNITKPEVLYTTYSHVMAMTQLILLHALTSITMYIP